MRSASPTSDGVGEEPAGTRVLVVEDEVALARLLGRMLGEEGFEPRLEFDGTAALDAAVEQPPDAVVLDLSLPGVDGLEVCRRMRSQGLAAPIIMLTARDTVPDRVRGLDAGADDYVVKPFAIEELLARVRAQLRRSTVEVERLQVADLTLEPASRRAVRGGTEVQLTAQEFGLLELLMRHPGQVLTRQRILDHVWGYAATPSSNVVDIYIHYLRDKIDRGHPPRLIHTVRSVGYTLRA